MSFVGHNKDLTWICCLHQQHPIQQWKPAAFARAAPAGQEKWLVPLMWHLGGHIWSTVFSFRALVQETCWQTRASPVEDTKMGWGVEGRTQREWLSSACSAGKREVKGGPSCSLHYTIEVHKEGKAKLFSEVHS